MSQRAAYARNFEAVCQPVVYKYAAGQGKYLRLVLEPAERSREYHSVVVALEIGACVYAFVMVFLHAEAFGGNEPFPAHPSVGRVRRVRHRFVPFI